MTILQLLIVLGIMVLVHEFGHFAVAKLCGIRVEVFSLGFGKRIVGFKRGDTMYQIAAVPLGGYVKMAGDNPGEDPTGDPGEFNAHPRWQRVLVALAGPVANFILAFVLLAGVSMLHNEVQEFLRGPAQADYIPVNTPVARTGIHSGDTIVHYGPVENPTWDQIDEKTALNLNQTIPFSYLHDGRRFDTSLFVESKGHPEDFDPNKFGLIPRMQTTPVVVAYTEADMPGAAAGLQPKDRIVAIDGLTLHSVIALISYLQDQAGKPATLNIVRGSQTVTIHLTPQIGDDGIGGKSYQIGLHLVPPPVHVEKLPLGKAIVASWKGNLRYASLISDVVKGMFTRHVSVRSLSGPIGIGQQIHEAASMPGWMPLIGLMAYISINLGMLNLLPFPILDGGMILFLVIESILRRDVNQHVKERVYQVAFMCIIVFAAMIIFNDLSKLPLFAKLKP